MVSFFDILKEDKPSKTIDERVDEILKDPYDICNFLSEREDIGVPEYDAVGYTLSSCSRQSSCLKESQEDYNGDILQFLQPYYIRLQGLMTSPLQLFENSKEGVEQIIKELDDIEREINSSLFGKSYSGLRGSPGGLHKEYQELADKRYNSAKACKELKNKIQEVNQRYEETKKLCTEDKSIENIKIHYLNLVGYKFDLFQKETEMRDISGDLEGYDCQVKFVGKYIEVAADLSRYIGDINQETKFFLKEYCQTESDLSSEEIIPTLMSRLHKKSLAYITCDLPISGFKPITLFGGKK